MLGQLESGGHAVVADMEAGAGTLTRMPERSLDWALLVTEPSTKSIEVSRRAAEIIRERHIAQVLVVANKVSGEADAATIREALAGHEVFEVPEDPAILLADRDGVAPIDLEPASPAVAAVTRLAARLAQ